jgi:hypothetical protein
MTGPSGRGAAAGRPGRNGPGPTSLGGAAPLGRTGTARAAPRRGALRRFILAGGLVLAGLGGGGLTQEIAPRPEGPGPALGASGRLLERRVSDYVISAHVFILGKMADVGTMSIEEELRRNGEALEKLLRMSGATKPEQVRKNRDYSGECVIRRTVPLRPDGSVDEAAVEAWRDCRKSTSSFLKMNKKYQAERVDFFRDHAVSRRDNGVEKQIEGSYESLLGPLEYLMEHDVEAGQVIDIPYVLNGVPRVFRAEVKGLANMDRYRSRAYEVAVSTLERVGDGEDDGKEAWRKKGNVKLWFCKDAPYRNVLLKMKIKFRWYLWLDFDLQRTQDPEGSAGAPAAADSSRSAGPAGMWRGLPV